MNQHHKPGQHGPADGPPNNPGSPNNPAPGGKPGDPLNGAPAEPVQPNEARQATGRTRGQPGSGDTKFGNAKSADAKASSKDIGPVLRGWDYEYGTINVRKISGADGRPKLQMRLDLGLLQMEMTGRPDGRRPFGSESLLEHYESRLAEHEKRTGGEDGFTLTGSECRSLREEAVMYYQRYLSLFVLEEFGGVVRDTGRNLRVLDLCNKFAVDEDDKLALEQYRPYLIMMNARAKASISLRDKRLKEALREIDRGLEDIREFFERYGQPEAFAGANEVKVLKRFAREVRKKLPVDPVRRLEKKLGKAVKDERYEEAAKLRDKLAAMKGQPEGPPSGHR